MRKIKVLIVDDSALIRKTLTEALATSQDIEVVGAAIDPYFAVNKINKLKPDVITLDIEMPRMDGLTFLKKLMISQPMPVIMVSALTDKGAEQTIKALELGAIDFILKPKLGDQESWDTFAAELVEKVTTAGGVKMRRRAISSPPPILEPAPELKRPGITVETKYSADVIIPKKKPMLSKQKTGSIIAIGASTGGTEVISKILSSLPEDMPGIVIVQHMPEKFTEAFANRINGYSRLYVKEAVHRDRIYKGVALIAPGNHHMLLRHDANGYWVEINDGLPVNRHRPAVDVLFRSAAQNAGENSVGILLTGMGADGAEGLLEMKEVGAHTIAQDEASSTVFGMPREAIMRGAAQEIMNIEQIITLLKNKFGVN